MPKQKRSKGPEGHSHADGIKCAKCDREFKEEEAREYPGKVFVHKGEVLCKDCLVEMGVMPDSANTYEVLRETISDLGKFGPGNVGT